MNTLLSYLDSSFMGYLQKIRNRFINSLLDCLNLYASHTAKLRGDFFRQIIDMLLFQVSKFFCRAGIQQKFWLLKILTAANACFHVAKEE